MALNIDNPEIEALVRKVTEKTGESAAQAVERSLCERLERIKGNNNGVSLADELDAIGKRCAALPDLDTRSADEILGYDESGLPS